MGMGNSTSVVARTRPGAKSGQDAFLSPFPLLPPVASSQHLSSVPALRRVDSTTPLLHSPRDSLQPFPPFSSVWGGGRWPPRESGAEERSECG